MAETADLASKNAGMNVRAILVQTAKGFLDRVSFWSTDFGNIIFMVVTKVNPFALSVGQIVCAGPNSQTPAQRRPAPAASSRSPRRMRHAAGQAEASLALPIWGKCHCNPEPAASL
jgi:hypothetical protein